MAILCLLFVFVVFVYFRNFVKQTCRDILSIDFRQLWEVPKHFSPDTLRYEVLEVSNVQTFLSSNAIKELNETCVEKSVYKIMSQSTSIFQHQWAGLWCDHRMPSVLCQSRRVYFHHLKGGSFMFFPSFFKQGSIFLIFTCKKRQKRIDRNQTNFPPARELALLILNVSCQISNSHRVVQPEQDSIIEAVALLANVPKAAVKASNGVRILGSNSNGTTTSYSYMMLHDVISSSIYASCAMEFILPTYLDDVMILMMYCHSSAAVLQNRLV